MMKITVATEVSDKLLNALQSLIPQLTGRMEVINYESVRDIVESENTFLFLATDETNNIQGTLTLVIFTIPTGKKAFIEDVVVDSAAQGLGVGRKLIEAAIEFAKEHEVTKIELSSNPSRVAANALYRKIGFEVRDTNFYRMQF